MKKTALLLSLILLLSGVSCSFIGIKDPVPGVTADAEKPMVSVSLEPCEGVLVTSENPVKVRSGEDAVFDVAFEDGYRFSPAGNLLYENGKITVQKVLYPTTVSGYCTALQPFRISLRANDASLGEQSFDCGAYEEGTGSPVTLRARAADGAVFLGFSKDRSFADGGEVISFDSTFQLTVNDDLTVYANYNPTDIGTVPGKNVQRVIYHMDGGKAFGSHDVFCADYADEYYYYPNTLPDLEYFQREGYVLAGYRTAEGKFVGCGWNAETDKNNMAELYACWLSETPLSNFTFEYDRATQGVRITSYTGSDETVAVPLSYRGKPVTAIGSGAFSGCSFRTLMISRNTVTVEDGAIRDCPGFTELIFSDGVQNISDAAIQNCPSFKTLKMSAVIMPRFCDDREGTYAIKYEHVRASANRKKLVIAGGSNLVYGIDSNILYDTLCPEYGFDVINYGCNKYAPSLFFLEACRPYFAEGDILLLCPEDSEFQFGLGRIVAYIWHYFESAYEAFAEVDIRHFENTFSTFAEFSATRRNMAPKTYQMKTTQTTNRFGDYIAEKKGHVKSFDPFTVSSKVNLQVQNVTKHSDALNAELDAYASMGVRVWLTHAVNNVNSLKDESRPGGRVFRSFEKTVGETLHCTVISSLEDYVMDPEYFYNSNQHLNSEGAALRTRMLLDDILRQISGEKGD